ncbi:GW dipeptide domain-containing protein [Neobacillus niacini]|uniref:peptidoglycan recognition protein family protein n=1 Tax=Neobacillus niacini TaxID=86668 RepID=UPI0028596C79|nr:GW dipeptide domain-containing protein [Neobacillus niacini]MDR6998931.1 bifunctional autolysin [Neobacillus niacini]
MKKAVILVVVLLMCSTIFPHWLTGGQVFAKAKYPDVNDYIASKKLTPVKMEAQHISNFPNFNYRNGFGMVEGVVAHETANNSSTIYGEIAYMTKYYNNAFVHAFVDGLHVIEIHSPNYGAWGAGPYANQRFVQVELVRVHSFDQFARSINNYANYLAYLLFEYNLGVIDAEKTGKGTLWSHNAVSKFLGGTTHTDPIGYFSTYGYTWSEFVKLVTKRYNSLSVVIDTNLLGYIKNENIEIYQEIGDDSTVTTADSTDTGKIYYIKKQAIEDGQIYFQLSNENGTLGWVKSSDLSVMPYSTVSKASKTFIIKGIGKGYSKEWGQSKDAIFSTLSVFKDQEFKVNLTEQIGNSTWYRGKLGGKTVWVYYGNVTTIQESSTSRLGTVQDASEKIYKSIGNVTSAIPAGSTYTNTVLYIKKQATANGKTYYLLSTQASSTKGVIGWMKSTDLTTVPYTEVDKNVKMFTIKGSGSAYKKAWGGSKDVSIGNLSVYKDQLFKAELTAKTGDAYWYRGNLAGKTVWIPSKSLNAIRESSTSRIGRVKSSSTVLYKQVGDLSTDFEAGTKYTDTVYYIKKQAVLNGETYYLLSTQPSSSKGVIGWAKASDTSTYSHTQVDQKTKKFVIKGIGSAYSKPWGGKKDIVYSKLSTYKGKTFTSTATEKVGTCLWYYGSFGGKKVWVSKGNLN